MGGYELDKFKINRLIWGDNLLAMQALLAHGYTGKIDLIYIDPPFDSDADYSYQVTIEGQQVEKQASIIERLAYIDTWEAGLDSYLDMMYPRLQLMKRLLSERGSLFLHIGVNVSHYMKIILDEIFGESNCRNEIVLPGRASKNLQQQFDNIAHLNVRHDVLLWYSVREEARFLPFWVDKHNTGNPEGHWHHFWSNADRPTMRYKLFGHTPKHGQWVWKEERALKAVENYRRFEAESGGRTLAEYWRDTGSCLEFIRPSPENGKPQYWREPAEMKLADTMWSGVPVYSNKNQYPTEKNEALLQQILKLASTEGSLVADFFCGSGTTMAVAERLGRRWIGCNLDKVGIQVSRNRLVNQGARPFLLENIGNYQRHMIYLSGSKIGEMQQIILKLYGAEPRSDRPDLGIHTLDGKDPELVYVGYPDRPITARKVIELQKEAEILDGNGYSKLTILAWDYDYNFSTELESRKAALLTPLKVNINPLTIPPEIYNYLKKAKNEAELDGLRDKITFHEKPYLRVSKPVVQETGGGKVVITLKIDRYVLMNYPIPEAQQVELRKAIKDNFAALIDYWAIDWNYDGKTFRSTWQAIRGNGKRAGTVVTVAESPELPALKRAIAVRLVDVFGNDASATVEVK